MARPIFPGPVVSLLEATDLPPCSVFTGFDGAIDSIYRLLASQSEKEIRPMAFMVEFADCVAAAANRSTNVGRLLQEVRCGGNALLCARTLAKLGAEVQLVANLGVPMEKIFSRMDLQLQPISWGPPNRTDALEFDDGKVMLVDSQPMETLSYGHLCRVVGKDLAAIFSQQRAVVLTNWTMTPQGTEIYEAILSNDLPNVPKEVLFFFDIADPRRRSDGELLSLMRLLGKFSATHTTFLSVNLAELERLAAAIGCEGEDLERQLQSLHRTFSLEWVVHRIDGAASFGKNGFCTAAGFPTDTPMTTTGGGDCFNGGFLFAHLNGLQRSHALLFANIVSASYVRRGTCPARAEALEFFGA